MVFPECLMTNHARRLLSPSEHHFFLHKKINGTVLYFKKANFNRRWKAISPQTTAGELFSFLSDLDGESDVYIGVNQFSRWRRTELLKYLRGNYVDLDYGRLVTQDDMNEVLCALQSQNLPSPSFVVFSGRGMHFYWIYEPVSPQALPVWQCIQNKLIMALSNFNVDRSVKDCTRVLRLVGTVNSKNSQDVYGLVLNQRDYDFQEFCNNILGEEQHSKKTKAEIKSLDVARTCKSYMHSSALPYRRWRLVYLDLIEIGKFHKTIPEGFRNEFLFIASVALSWFASPDSIKDEVLNIARRFCRDLPEKEVIQTTLISMNRAKAAIEGKKSVWCGVAVDPRYRMRRKTLYDKLGVLADPLIEKIKAIIPDRLADQREVVRQKNRDRSKEGRYEDKNSKEGFRESNRYRKDKAIKMKHEGLSVRKIADHLEISQTTVFRWISQV